MTPNDRLEALKAGRTNARATFLVAEMRLGLVALYDDAIERLEREQGLADASAKRDQTSDTFETLHNPAPVSCPSCGAAVNRRGWACYNPWHLTAKPAADFYDGIADRPPNVALPEAIEKRFRNMLRSNDFTDARIGEKNYSIQALRVAIAAALATAKRDAWEEAADFLESEGLTITRALNAERDRLYPPTTP